jgi:hypothetical protein
VVFQEPERIVHPPSWLDNTPFAFWIMDALRPSTFVELGCHSGNSYASFAQAVQMLGLSTRCYGVDTWRGDPHAGFFDEKVFEDWSTYHNRRFSSFSRLIRSTFDEAVGQFRDGSIDLLHLDGYHTLEAVTHDFHAWRPKLSDRAVVLCHDIDVREKDFGAWRLWERLKDDYPSFDLRHGHGLGVLGIGKDLPEAVRWLLALRSGHPDRAKTVRLFFARLGAAVLGGYSAKEAERLASGLRTPRDKAIKDARATVVERTAETVRLAAHLRSRDAQVARLEVELDASERALSAAEMMARRLDGEAAALLERLQRDTSHLLEETTRRTSVEALLRWTQSQVLALSTGESSSRLTSAPEHEAAASGSVATALRSIGAIPGTVAQALRIGAKQGEPRYLSAIEASGLFDEEWYRSRNPEVAERGMNPLVHFITIGAAEERDPHPLFSTAFYTSQVTGLAARGENPLHHYVTQGWRTGCAPHPLFDPSFYVAQSPDVARWGGDPLTHYLEYGAAERRSPHPLFDVDFYLRENPDALADGMTPLTHFILKGARARRRPSPFFDCAYYLERYEDVAESGVNPLEHFVQFGWREWRNPSATFSVEDYLTRYADVRESGENPLVHYVRYGRAQGRQATPASRVRRGRPRRSDTTRIALSAVPLAPQADSRPTILLVSHVGPWRPRAGNEYRVDRMLHWYRQRGYRTIPLIAPLPGGELPPEAVEEIAATFGNAIQIHRDGRLEYILRDMPDVLASLDGTFTPSFADLLEEGGASAQERELLTLERTFCHDAVVSTVLHLQRSLGPHILQVEYIWMTRLLPLVRGGDVLKVVDTHDVFSSIAQKVRMFGVRDVAIEPHQEAERLRRADLAIAIQDDEREELVRLAPSMPVITAGVDFDMAKDEPAPSAGQLLFVASNNARNRKGLEDFLRLAWPRIRQHVPRAELVVVGSVVRALDGREVSGVTAMGPVDDLTARYRDAALVINPVVAGTGLKIKILEALCHLRPVVTWPAGIDGVDPKLATFCLLARDWYEFSTHVISGLTRPDGEGLTAADRAVISELVSPEHVYASLDTTCRAFFESQRPVAAERMPIAPRVSASSVGGHAGN